MDELFDIDMRFSDREWNAIGKAAAKKGETRQEYVENLLNPNIEQWTHLGNPLEKIIARAFLKANRTRIQPPKRVKLKPRKYDRL